MTGAMSPETNAMALNSEGCDGSYQLECSLLRASIDYSKQPSCFDSTLTLTSHKTSGCLIVSSLLNTTG
jgi:hypothetical protein